MSKNLSPSSQPLYAVIDLGSNSFHMLISRLVADSVQVVDKIKRKVRLAAGLDANNFLDDRAMARGWECLSFFAERLQDIPPENIKIVATATLRLAQNSDEFMQIAQRILGHKVHLISGEQEAELIYLGVAHTSSCADKRLVIDIGGASTELIIGDGFDPIKVCSLDMGCVTFNSNYFACGEFSEQAFGDAIAKASQQLDSIAGSYKQAGWDVVLGVSGTIQAVAEVIQVQKLQGGISLSNLLALKQQVIACQVIEELNIHGLEAERKPVFAPGLAILIAIFQCLSVRDMFVSGGAIREGLLYELLPDMRDIGIRERTVNGLINRYSIDQVHANKVGEVGKAIFAQLQEPWQLNDASAELLSNACSLHEIGLLLEYKGNKQHASYIIEHTDLAGYSALERGCLKALVSNYKTDLNFESIEQQGLLAPAQMRRLIVLLRLAVILSKRRNDSAMPEITCLAEEHNIIVQLSQQWLDRHPLIFAELNQEIEFCQQLDIFLTIQGYS
ncbi:guanosine-5'-triphosphate,3'-diphosphate pyrophosphatase [Thalassotalea aquiviva]|uniref:Ppx/GppA phosphatase family protein n=1 Tax=Thalassotalea aquiviva TaxID=3242415 RepID=UPI003529F5EB